MNNKKKILIVEDSTLVRYKIKEILREFAVEILELDNAEDIFIFSKIYQKVDLIILDINLPDMDGLTALEKMYMDKKWISVPIIMLTGRADRITVQKALKSGVINYIRKPFTEGQLIERIQQILGPLPLSQENSEVFSYENLHEKIYIELERAKMGDYKVSILEIDILNNASNFDNLENLIRLRDKINNLLRNIDSICITENRSLLLILPFVDENDAMSVSEKIHMWYEEQYNDKFKYYIGTFPKDGKDSKELLRNLQKSKNI